MSGTDISAFMYMCFIILGVAALYATSKGIISSKTYYIYMAILLIVGVVVIEPVR